MPTAAVRNRRRSAVRTMNARLLLQSTAMPVDTCICLGLILYYVHRGALAPEVALRLFRMQLAAPEQVLERIKSVLSQLSPPSTRQRRLSRAGSNRSLADVTNLPR